MAQLKKENIFHAAGATSPSGMARQRIVEMVKNSGFVPVERDALYNELKVYK
jgi:aminodeoxyfutalosine synthase